MLINMDLFQAELIVVIAVVAKIDIGVFDGLDWHALDHKLKGGQANAFPRLNTALKVGPFVVSAQHSYVSAVDRIFRIDDKDLIGTPQRVAWNHHEWIVDSSLQRSLHEHANAEWYGLRGIVPSIGILDSGDGIHDAGFRINGSLSSYNMPDPLVLHAAKT